MRLPARFALVFGLDERRWRTWHNNHADDDDRRTDRRILHCILCTVRSTAYTTWKVRARKTLTFFFHYLIVRSECVVSIAWTWTYNAILSLQSFGIIIMIFIHSICLLFVSFQFWIWYGDMGQPSLLTRHRFNRNELRKWGKNIISISFTFPDAFTVRQMWIVECHVRKCKFSFEQHSPLRRSLAVHTISCLLLNNLREMKWNPSIPFNIQCTLYVLYRITYAVSWN